MANSTDPADTMSQNMASNSQNSPMIKPAVNQGEASSNQGTVVRTMQFSNWILSNPFSLPF